MAGDMGPPPARTSFKRSASDDKEETLSTPKRAKPSSSRSSTASQAKSTVEERPKRYTPDGREIPYVKPRPNGSWRMITGEDIVYSPEERPTRAPPLKEKPSSQPTITQSFGQSTSSGKPRKRERIVVPPTPASTIANAVSSSMRSNQSSKSSSRMSSSSASRPNQPSSQDPQSQQATEQSNSNTSTTTKTIQLVESTGDIFTAPPNTLIIHACNTEGSWGAGIAKAFKDNYPSAFEIYRSHCQLNGVELVGKALLIPPQDDDEKRHLIGCLFTSISKGRKVDSPTKILSATGPAMSDLFRQVKAYNSAHEPSRAVAEARMCKINSGLFNVKWEKTKDVIQRIPVEEEGGIDRIRVISRSEED